MKGKWVRCKHFIKTKKLYQKQWFTKKMKILWIMMKMKIFEYKFLLIYVEKKKKNL